MWEREERDREKERHMSYITDKVTDRKTHQVTASDKNEGLDSVKSPSYTTFLRGE